MMGRCGQPADSLSIAKWDGGLTVETTNARGTQKRVYKK